MNKYKILPVLCILSLFSILSESAKSAAPEMNPLMFRAQDSLRAGTLIKGLNSFSKELQDSIIPLVNGDEKKNLKTEAAELKKLLKSAEGQFRDTMQTDFS